MNPRQKSYDSYDKTNKLLKLTNSYYHYRNLETIKKRRPQYSNVPIYFQKFKSSRTTSKKRQTTLFYEYNIKKQNESIKKKINQILLRPIKPKLNSEFFSKETKLQKVRQLHKNIFDQKRNEDNQNYKKRIINQRAFINPKIMDKNYKEEHTKVLMKLKKIGENENVVLPNIKNSNDNPSAFDFHKYYYSTSSNIRSKKDNESNTKNMKSINASSVSNTYYGNNNNDCGTNSVDK